MKQQHRRCVFRPLGLLEVLLFSLLLVLETGNRMVVVSALLTLFAPRRRPSSIVILPSASAGSCFTRLATDQAILHKNHAHCHTKIISTRIQLAPSITKRRTLTTALSSSTSSTASSSASSSSSSSPPPPVLSLENISCSHNGGETWQLKDVSYVLPRGAKVALVGRNGTGKSTLLKILAEHACRRGRGGGGGGDGNSAAVAGDLGFQYEGQVTIPRNVRVAYVEQEPYTSSQVTVADALLGIRSAADNAAAAAADNSVYTAVHAYRCAVDHAEADPQAFAAACAEMEAHSGSWDVWTKMEEVATKLRIRHLQNEPLSNLSGGELKRVSLAAALVLEPDVLLLDEPSNWLSLAGVQWLTDLLLKYDKKLTILMVTHDRIFLDQVCDRILELDQGSLYEYVDCDYAGYLQAKEERLAMQDAAAQSARAKYRVELDWMRRQPQARQTKAKARIDAFYKLQKATKPRPQDPNLNLINEENNARRLGGKIISMRNVNLQFGDRIMLKDFSYDFCKGDRICICGANGVGKTTFLRLLTGEQPADSGEIEIGETIVLGVYDQMGLQLKADQDAQKTTVLAFVTEAVLQSFQVESLAMTDAPVEARRLLNKFEFPRSRWNERISVLSGGEKRRLQMLSVLSRRPNVLIMDEPSVDCDLDTIMALETYLEEFAGVLLIVSHDRAFASKVTDHLFIFEGDGEIMDFQGSLSEYASALVEIENQSIPGGSSPSSLTPSSSGQGNDADDEKIAAAEKKEQINRVRQAKKDMDKLDRAVEKLREKAKAVQKELDNKSDEGWTKLAELTDTLTALNDEIDEKEMQWMELAEVAE